MVGASSPFHRVLTQRRIEPATFRWVILTLTPLFIVSVLDEFGVLPNAGRTYPIFLTLTNGVFFVWLWRLALKKPVQEGRLGWILTALMLTTALATVVLWVFVYPNGAMRDEIGIPEGLYFASIALLILATLTLRRSGPRTRTYDIQAILDITVMGASSAAVGWYYLIRPLSSQIFAGGTGMSLVDVSPYGQIAIFTIASAILLQRTARSPSHLYAIAMLFMVAADVYLAFIVKGIAPLDTIGTGSWTLGIALYVLDASRKPAPAPARTKTEPFIEDPAPALRVLPYLVAAGALLLLIIGTNFQGADQTTRQQILLFGASILLLLMLRQVVTLADNRRLTAHLVAANEELRLQATHDHLTWLLNRSAFMEHFTEAITHARAEGTTIALIFTDLNKFKAVNDSHGHLVGDQLLVIVAETIRTMLPQNGIATRLGGDEFMIALPGHDREEAQAFVTRLSRRLDGNVMPEYGSLPISLAAGTAVYPIDGVDPEHLINQADLAMYEHKKSIKRA